MKTAKKIWKFLISMKFAVALLIILAAACSIASLVTQGQSFSWYAQRYSERTAAVILALGLDDAFHSPWFISISAFLCLNLLFCTLHQLPGLVKRTKAHGSPSAEAEVRAEGVEDAEKLFNKLGMRNIVRGNDGEGRETLFSSKNAAGFWGAFVCHIGILLLIVGFSLGQMTHEEFTAYGVPGQSREIGDTGLVLMIDDFKVGLREDDTVEQYEAEITVTDPAEGTGRTAKISVNNPADLFGLRFYQNSTGWAAKVCVFKDGTPLDCEIVCAGELLPVKDRPELVIYFNALYPDLVMVSGSGPQTASGRLNNPGYLYSVFYNGELLGMNVLKEGEVLTIDEYTVTFSEPQSYTLIQIKRDSFAPVALAGGLITLIGLFLAFYIQPQKLWAVKEKSGWTVSASSRRGGRLFRDRLLEAAGGVKND